MNIIKNIKLLDDLDPPAIELLEKAAHLHRSISNIQFKILENTPKKLAVRVVQEKNAAGIYHSGARLNAIVKETFGPFFTGKQIVARPFPYTQSDALNIDKKWIEKQMLDNGIRVKDIVDDTGLNRSQINSLISGNRPLSQTAKAMLYFYFKSKESKN